MVLPHYLRSTEINIPKNEEEKQREDMNKQAIFSPESPELDIPMLLPRDSEALNESKCTNTLQNDQSRFDLTNKEHESSSFIQDTNVDSLAQHTQIDGLVDQPQHDNMFDQRLTSCNENSVEWWETQEQGKEVDSTSEPSQTGPRTSCHCQVSSD